MEFGVYSYRECSFAASREQFSFDAAIADAVDTSPKARCSSIRTAGLDLYQSEPGKVVLVTSLWLYPPPEEWELCVALPLRDPKQLFVAVHKVLAGKAQLPAVEEIERCLAVPRAGARHVGRAEGGEH